MIELTGPVADLSDKDLNRHIAQVGILSDECKPSERGWVPVIFDLLQAEKERRSPPITHT